MVVLNRFVVTVFSSSGSFIYLDIIFFYYFGANLEQFSKIFAVVIWE